MPIIDVYEMPGSEAARRFEGERYGDIGVSFFLSDTAPGSGPSLHKHPYAEVFIAREGAATFTVGDEVIEAPAGQVVIAPSGTPHRFVNSGAGPLRQIGIHPQNRMVTEWLEDEEDRR